MDPNFINAFSWGQSKLSIITTNLHKLKGKLFWVQIYFVESGFIKKYVPTVRQVIRLKELQQLCKSQILFSALLLKLSKIFKSSNKMRVMEFHFREKKNFLIFLAVYLSIYGMYYWNAQSSLLNDKISPEKTRNLNWT